MNFVRMTLLTFVVLPLIAAAAPTIHLKIQNGNSAAGQTLLVTAEVKDVLDLDTYSFEIRYNAKALSLIHAAPDAPLMNITNVLSTKGRTFLPVIKKSEGVVQIAATLSGSKSGLGAAKSGVIGIAVFNGTGDSSGEIELQNIRLLDSKGKPMEIVTVSK